MFEAEVGLWGEVEVEVEVDGIKRLARCEV